MNRFERLDVWRMAHTLVLEVYKVTSNFPNNEKYGIIDQLRRTAVSVAANIVEGNSRQHTKEKIQFIFMSKGSLEEVRYFLLLSRDLKLLSTDHYDRLLVLTDDCGRLLNGYSRYYKNLKSNA